MLKMKTCCFRPLAVASVEAIKKNLKREDKWCGHVEIGKHTWHEQYSVVWKCFDAILSIYHTPVYVRKEFKTSKSSSPFCSLLYLFYISVTYFQHPIWIMQTDLRAASGSHRLKYHTLRYKTQTASLFLDSSLSLTCENFLSFCLWSVLVSLSPHWILFFLNCLHMSLSEVLHRMWQVPVCATVFPFALGNMQPLVSWLNGLI